MNFWSKLFITVFSISVTVITSIVGAVEWFDNRAEVKVVKSEEKIMNTMSNWRDQRRAEIKAGDDILSTRITGIEKTIDSIDKNVRVLIQMQKTATDHENQNRVYSLNESNSKKVY